MHQNYIDCLNYFERAGYEEINGFDFYCDLFPDNQNHGETSQYLRPNAIYLFHDERLHGTKYNRRIMFADTWENDYLEYVEGNPDTLCSGIAYLGRANKKERAVKAYALIIDLDGVGEGELDRFFQRCAFKHTELWSFPTPAYIALSGSGIHLYYVYDKPINLYPNIKDQLNRYKKALTRKVWDYGSTSTEEKVQCNQSIYQGFRMVGSINKSYGTEIKAFRTSEKLSLAELNLYVKEELKVDLEAQYAPSTMTLEEAKEKYNDWYCKVIINGDYSVNRWKIENQKGHKGDELYNWWVRQVDNEELTGGHRYYYMYCLASYARKCNIQKTRLEEDLKMVFEKLKVMPHKNKLEKFDMEAALQAYDDERIVLLRRESVSLLSGLPISENRRNGRKQAEHVKLMNFVRDEINGNKNWREGNGRKSKQEIVLDFCRDNPEATKADCHRATGLDPKTIRKWWEQR